MNSFERAAPIAALLLRAEGKSMLAAQASEIGLKKMRFEVRSQCSSLGGKVKPGLFGKYFGLTDLDNGDLIKTDFRSVCGGVLEQWLHAPSAAVLGREFPPVALV